MSVGPMTERIISISIREVITIATTGNMDRIIKCIISREAMLSRPE